MNFILILVGIGLALVARLVKLFGSYIEGKLNRFDFIALIIFISSAGVFWFAGFRYMTS